MQRACALAGVSRRTLYAWMTAGKVEFILIASGRRRLFIDSLFRDGNVSADQAVRRAAPLPPFPVGPLVPLLRSKLYPPARTKGVGA